MGWRKNKNGMQKEWKWDGERAKIDGDRMEIYRLLYIWTIHVTHMNESCLTNGCVMPHAWMSHGTHAYMYTCMPCVYVYSSACRMWKRQACRMWKRQACRMWKRQTCRQTHLRYSSCLLGEKLIWDMTQSYVTVWCTTPITDSKILVMSQI